jgi:hypothetical protein
MAQKDKDSDAYKTLETYSEYLNNVLNDIELITGADSKIAETFELYLSDVKARDIERAKLDNLDAFLKDDNGKYRTSKNTTLSGFMKERVEIEGRLSQNAGKYETLKPYLDDSGKVKAEF